MSDAFSLKFTVDGAEQSGLALAFQGKLQETIDAQVGTLKTAYQRAMDRGVTQPGKRRLRSTLEASGFYRAGSLAKTWQANTYPRGVGSLGPAAVFTSSAALIVNAFEDGVTISAKSGKFLAIPEGPAKAIIHRLNQGAFRSRDDLGRYAAEADPTQRVAAALGVQLVPLMNPRTGRGVLVASTGAKLTRGGRFAKSQMGRPTPLFALVRTATLKKRPMGRQVLADIQSGAVGDFTGALAAELPAENQG